MALNRLAAVIRAGFGLSQAVHDADSDGISKLFLEYDWKLNDGGTPSENPSYKTVANGSMNMDQIDGSGAGITVTLTRSGTAEWEIQNTSGEEKWRKRLRMILDPEEGFDEGTFLVDFNGNKIGDAVFGFNPGIIIPNNQIAKINSISFDIQQPLV